jgi:hypothetical protein
MTPTTIRHGRSVGLAFLALLLWGVAALWSWNTFAVDLLGFSEMAFRHALALCLLVLSVGGLLTLPWWIARKGQA